MGLGYDAASRIDRLFDPATSVNQLRYAYDGLDRLTGTQDGTSLDPVESYAYDATGNRTSFTSNDSLGMPVTQTYTYAPLSHWLTNIDAATRTYDLAGNTLTMNGRTFTYTPAGRLRDVVGGPAAMSYTYNPIGEQVRRYQTANPTGAQDYYVYDEQGHWIGSYDVNGTMKQQIVWLEDYPVGLVNASGLKYIEPDHLGTPRAVIEVARNVAVWTWDAKSEAFGNTLPSENPDGDAFSLVFDMRFPGQRFDAAAGMNYNYFRDYDASTGRYGQSDPIGLMGGLSTYTYVSGNAVNSIDPLGLTELILFGRSDHGGLFFDSATAYQSPKGVYTVGGHGNPKEMRTASNFMVTPEMLRDMLNKDMRYKNAEKVQLASCNTGRHGDKSFAQKLANLLGKPVIAPDSYVFYSTDGTFFLGDADTKKGSYVPGTSGNWVTFYPINSVPTRL